MTESLMPQRRSPPLSSAERQRRHRTKLGLRTINVPAELMETIQRERQRLALSVNGVIERAMQLVAAETKVKKRPGSGSGGEPSGGLHTPDLFSTGGRANARG